jgi:hypothetical protein
MKTKALKSNVFIGLILMSLISCQESTKYITLVNDSELNRDNEPILLSQEDIANLIDEKVSNFAVYINSESIPFQLDDLDKDGSWDEMALQVDFKPNETKKLEFKTVPRDEILEFEQRTNVRMGYSENLDDVFKEMDKITMDENHIAQESPRPYQLEGPSWENDKIGFRLYFDVRNGKDIFGKKIPDIVLDTLVDSHRSYHLEAPWGMDILKVGTSLGAGALAFVEADTLKRLGNTKNVTFEKIVEGPVRTIFTLTYKDWPLNGKTVDVIEKVTIWVGKYGYESTVRLSDGDEPGILVTGIVNLHSHEVFTINSGQHSAIYTHDDQSYTENKLGMAVVTPAEYFIESGKTANENVEITNTYFVKIKLDKNNSAGFSFYGGWEESDPSFRDKKKFEDYIRTEMVKLDKPIRIDI